MRIMHEAQMHGLSSFVTLTYDDDHIPHDWSLRYSDFQLFVERVRRRYPGARFFMCGEYGDATLRPHYHACLFGVHFSDRKLFSKSGAGSDLYTSSELSALWANGHASVGDLTFESAAYVARYVTKKLNKPDDDRLLRFDDNGVCYWLAPEFARMSLKPGIGANWWKKYGQEVLARGNVVMRGVEMKVPRYYAKLCSDPKFDWIEYKNQQAFKPADSTDDRLAVREFVQQAKLDNLKRGL